MSGGLAIRDFQPGDEAAFRALNEEWITRYFVLEEKDRKSFDDPQRTILAHGGRIFFALQGEDALGCCALVPLGAAEYEVAKMAVTERAKGLGIGRAILEHTIAQARSLAATRLYLETNHALTPAIGLYESVGFRDVPAERLVPTPYVRADVFMELYL